MIGLVALLVALLLPALGSARAAARTARCSANMRQLGQAGAAYAADHHLRIRGWVTTTGPRRGPGHPRDARWWVGLGGYLSGPTARRGTLVVSHVLMPSAPLNATVRGLNCPAIDPGDGYRMIDETATVTGGCTSAVNRMFDFRHPPDRDPEGAHPRGKMIRLLDVAEPAALLHFADGWGNLFPSANLKNWIDAPNWSGREATAYRPGLYGGQHAAPKRRDHVFWPHPGDATQAVFLDGHAETRTGGLDRATLDPWNG